MVDFENKEFFSEDSIDEFKDAFGLYENEEHLVSANDLWQLLRTLGQNPTEAELHDMLKEFDPDDTGFMDFETFIKLLEKNLKGPETEEELRETFQIFDREGTGYITTADLKHIMNNLGEQYTNEEVDDMMKEGDMDGDGKMSFEDFFLLMTLS